MKASSERILWEGRPAWLGYGWLYVVASVSLFRAVLGFRVGEPLLAAIYAVGAAALVGLAALLRSSVWYRLSRERLEIHTGVFRKGVRVVPTAAIERAALRQSRLGRMFGVGSVEVHIRSAAPHERPLLIRGIDQPEVLEARLNALR